MFYLLHAGRVIETRLTQQAADRRLADIFLWHGKMADWVAIEAPSVSQAEEIYRAMLVAEVAE